MRWIPARLRATRSRYQRGGEQHGEDTSAAESKSSARTRAVIRGVAAALIRRSKLPLGIGAQRTLRGPSPWVGYRVDRSAQEVPRSHMQRSSSGSADTAFGQITPSPPTHYRNRLKKVQVVDGQGRVRVQLGKPAHLHRNSRWHDNSLQATGDVRRVVGRLGKGGTAWNEGSCGRGSHQGNQRVVTFVETEVGAPRRTSPTGHQRNASSTR